MTPNFFCFKNMNHVTQPKNSYWCWAACLSKMITGLSAPSRIGAKQCQLVSYYKDSSIHNKSASTGSSCCGSSQVINHGCNLALDENDLQNVFKEGGFIAAQIEDLNTLDDFQAIKDMLRADQSPIVLKTRTSGYGHMILINGYGEKDGCNYILASNPIGAIGERYMEFDYFKSQIQIEKAWETVVNIKGNLVLDAVLIDSIKSIQSFINNHVKPNTKNPKLLDPWNYLTYKNLQSIAKDILSGQLVSLPIGGLLNNLSVDFDAQTENICPVTVHRDTVLLGEINFISEENLVSNNISLGGSVNQSYFKEYATRVHVKEEYGEIRIRPISYPSNYILEKKWQSYRDFYNQLTHPLNPKIQFFKNNMPVLEAKEMVLTT